jgi:tetratricopeptide (TPR) repeat protein
MPNTDATLTEASNCLWDDPQRSLDLCNRYLDRYPEHPHGLFSRHQAWKRLGQFDCALEDINAALAREPDAVSYSSRALVYRELDDHERAVEDLTRARLLDEHGWIDSLDPLFRADSFARLGRLEEALADCRLIPEDHQAPAFYDLPGGDKRQFIDQIRQRALAARASRQ